WGEALFMQNGINTANYIELASLRRPGAEIKEALLPLGSLHLSYGITDNLNAEAFYQFEWKHTEDAPVGSYYSTHDSYHAFGGESVIVDGRVVGYSQNGNEQEAFGMGQVFSGYNQLVHGTDSTYVTLNRTKDEKASSQGQFGVSARYFADSLGGTEAASYYTGTHVTLPIISARDKTPARRRGQYRQSARRGQSGQ